MDLATILGLGLALASLLVSLIMEGGTLASLLNPSALVLIVGGTIGVTMISFPMKDVARLPSFLMEAIKGAEPDLRGITDSLVKFAELARKEGLLGLENKASTAPTPLMAHGLELAADAMDPEQVEMILAAEMAENQRQAKIGAEILEAAGGYSPTMGIIGTVMGLVHVLGNISNTEELAGAIAVAFLATFYGIALANLVWLPLGGKLKQRAKQQKVADEVVVEGVLSILQGTSPRLVRDKLETMAGLRSAAAAQGSAVAGGEAGAKSEA